jgi:hypothetical protein
VSHDNRLVYSRSFVTREAAEAAVIAARNQFHTNNDRDRAAAL